ncbi:4-hydroxybenzoate octaprenyltransferase [Candidatus Enterovibrio escicola]|uniref:4-hydroxybenzoate octaprenyltransferase n=1 Tax=Candidatus Enterovibrio escicola TaxID=1927127 RepID=A0A2A5T508_9GAMM|nr:4-hydroxybenzoate octaprenyltransferase [Candidatus Enterovibrio escacola]PCS23226.1 4-hydroxybenzoate polyprenyltransferase [Candidatus Enterovibrio escacola]
MDMAKVRVFWQLMRMDRPIGSFLLLWPTMWALFFAADGFPNPHVLVVFLLGVVMMRAAGCVINDFADRDFDKHVKRTKSRPFPSGKVTTKEALWLFSFLVLCSFLLVLTLDPLTIQLSVIALIFVAVYPYMKRYTHMPQLMLGMSFSWVIPMAYAAQTGEVSPVSWILFLANVAWTVAYDTLYAMVDSDDDVKVGVKSSAILFGRFDKVAIGVLQLVTVLLLVLVGYLSDLAIFYYCCLLMVSSLFVYQQWLVRSRDRDVCFQAFLNNNYVGMWISIGVCVSVLL